MARYLVLGCDRQARRVALTDGFRRYYIGRAAGALPAAGVSLHGAASAQGFSLMTDARDGQVYRLTIEAVDGAPDPLMDPALGRRDP